jgi:enterochelin esterase-like enzyme
VLEIPETEIRQRIVLVGWSFGSIIALEMASSWPSLFGKLILPSVGPVTGVPVMMDDPVNNLLISSLDNQHSKDACVRRMQPIANAL